MGNSSFAQDRFLGGEWSPHAQGRVNDPAYKTAMATCHNGLPVEQGAWIRRSGFRFLAHPRAGAAAVLHDFDFSTTQPYQMEFTALKLRFFAGLGQVTTEDGPRIIQTVTDDAHARVIFANEIPSAWANGDYIKFNINSSPCSAPLLCGREFLLADKSIGDASFTLKDAITGAYIDGATIDYDLPEGAPADTVDKIFELTTPYTADDLAGIRTVQDVNSVLVLNGSYAPRNVTHLTPFQINTVIFYDGPYYDINGTTTTLTSSGTTGSVTVTASSTVGINDGNGFETTDVGRLIRMSIAPPAWDVGATYVKDDIVTGSDGNIYKAVAGANIGHDPTTDNTNTYWELTADEVTWTWLKITARTNSTHVTATVMGDDLPSTTATATWRLGLYSDTTGWPTCGAYHESRIWLSGVVKNRVDACTSNNLDPLTGKAMAADTFNFSPTSADGTVSDANAIAEIFNAKEANPIFWMLSTEDGLICGTQGGNFRVKASSMDDPLAPSTGQARRVATMGAANVEPVNASRNVYVQRAGRKLLAMEQVSADRYIDDNVSKDADHLLAGKVVEIRWQQEPSLSLWSRLATGGLTGTVYQKGLTKDDDFAGFFSVEHGDLRSFESISAGPSYDGLSDALYAVTNQTDSDEPDYNVRSIEYMMPRFDAASLDWSAFFVDGGANPCCAQLQAIANGDSFDGLRVYGLWHLNGKMIQPVIGGLDLGDIAVSGGFADIPFGSPAEWTLAFFTGLSDGTDYGVFALDTTFSDHNVPVLPPITANSLIGLVGTTAVLATLGVNDYAHFDNAHNYVYQVQAQGAGDPSSGIRKLDGGSSLTPTGDEILAVTEAIIGGAVNTYGLTDTVSYLHRDGFLYSFTGATASSIISQIDTTTLTETDNYGTHSTSFVTESPLGFMSMAGPRFADQIQGLVNFLVWVGNSSAGVYNRIMVIRTDDLSAVDYNADRAAAVWDILTTYAKNDFVTASDGTLYRSLSGGNLGHSPLTPGTVWWGTNEYITEDAASVCTSKDYEDFAQFYIVGHEALAFTAQTTAMPIYECAIAFDAGEHSGDPRVTKRQIGSVAIASVDAQWTKFTDVIGPAYDHSDGHLIFFLDTTDVGATNKHRIVKISSKDASVIWSTAVPTNTFSYATNQSMSIADIRGKFSYWDNANKRVTLVDTATGALTHTAWNPGFSASTQQYWDQTSSSIMFFCSYSDAGSPDPVYIGNYLPAHGNALSNKWGRIFTGQTHPVADTVVDYTVPASIGFTYTSRGQLLRPDYGSDAGTQNGPAFGKLRRPHWYATAFYRSRGVSVGTDFAALDPVVMADAGGTPLTAPTLYSGIASTTIEGDYSFEGQIAWEVTRPYPVTVLTVGGYIEGMDK